MSTNLTSTEIIRKEKEWFKKLREAENRLLEPIIDHCLELARNLMTKNTIRVHVDELTKHSPSPIFAHCRKLIQEGVDPKTRLEIYRSEGSTDFIIEEIGEGAKLSVDEEKSTRIVKYKPYSGPR